MNPFLNIKRALFGAFALSSVIALSGCLEPETEIHTVIVGGADSVKLAKEGVALKLCFQGRFGIDTLKTDRTFVTTAGDSARFETVKFYVSEIALVDSTGKSHYLVGTHLVDLLDSASVARGYAIVNLKALPGSYRGVRFSIGVPYEQNHRDAATQAAPLGTASGMFWGWNSGYIFHRIEGKVDSAGTPKGFAYHIGEDSRKLQVSFYSLTGATSSLVIESGHHAAKISGVAKSAHEPDNRISVKVAYDALFSTGLNTAAPLKPSINVPERAAHFGPISDRLFLNSRALFSLAH